MLRQVRRQEALRALGLLGVTGRNAHFLDLPDSRLSRHRNELGRRLRDLLARVDPDKVFVPFRYDQNPDHQALYRAALEVLSTVAARRAPQLIEYFVYPRMKLLPCGDVRALVDQRHLLRVDTRTVSESKREALMSYESQTTRYFDWQTRPNLTRALIDQVSAEPEFFLPYDPALARSSVLRGMRYWVPAANWLEPRLKRIKDRLKMRKRVPKVLGPWGRTGESL